jgi:hypothetical protein
MERRAEISTRDFFASGDFYKWHINLVDVPPPPPEIVVSPSLVLAAGGYSKLIFF